MGTITCKFIGWDGALPELAARRLRALARGSHPADFSHLAVVLPTAEAGRALRERLAGLCVDSGGAVNLRIIQPERLARPEESATPSEVLLAWRETLRTADGRDFPELFRNDVLERFRDSDETLFGWAELLQKCRMELAAEGLSLDAAAEKLDAFCRISAVESGQERFCRFEEFRRLEKRYLDRLRRVGVGRPDPASAQLAALERPEPEPGTELAVLIDCGDLKGAPALWLERVNLAVECWINAPEEYAVHFDAFGRPEPEFWNSVPIGLEVESRVRCVPRPDQQARRILELLEASERLPVAVGVLDAEVAAALENHAGVTPGAPTFFVPREIPLNQLPWSRLLSELVALYGDDSVDAAAAVWRDPLFFDYAERLTGVATAALNLLDLWKERHLVGNMDFLAELLDKSAEPGASGLAELSSDWRRWRSVLRAAENPVTAAYGILAEIGEANRLRHLDLRRSENELLLLKRAVFDLSKLSAEPDVFPELLRTLLGSIRMRLREESPEAVDVIGFLELGWSSDRTLIVAGFNEENFDAANSGDDPFLPESARAQLGMITRDRRRAADALRFKALAQCRDLRLLYGRGTQSGETLRPARLLFQCRNDELPRRVELLFDGALIEEPETAATASPPFAIRRREAPPSMSITSFRAYLECPFTFYLERVLRLERRNLSAAELDNLGYGTLMHAVLRDCAERDGAEAAELAAFARRSLERRCRSDFGERAPGILLLQRELLEAGLDYFAVAQHAEHLSGWRIVACETAVRVPWHELFEKIFPESPAEEWRKNVLLSGQLDRIDRRDVPGAPPELRVLDYKTNAKGVAPEAAHLCRSVPEEERCFRLAEHCLLSRDAVAYWQDLQLPLYVLLVRHCLLDTWALPSSTRIGAGYFNLPLELTATGVAMFSQLEDGTTLRSAALCADAVLRLIYVERRFFPPRKERFELFEGCEVDTGAFLDPGSEARS